MGHFQRKPIWYANLNKDNFGISLSTDRKLLAVFNNKTVLIVKARSGEVVGSTNIDASRVGWNRIKWSPSGKRLLISSVGDLRVINVENGSVETDIHLSDAPIATRGLSYPHEDYAMLDNSLLVHLPSKIRVCSYSGAGSSVYGDTAFIAVQGSSSGVLVASSFPHPAAANTLKKAQDDPEMFLIHPGVAVSIDVSQVPAQYQAEVKTGLQKSATNSGYKVNDGAPIKLAAKITGPKTEAVSYIARGSYVVKQYNSEVQVKWNGKNLWRRSGTNVPHMLMTKGGESIEDALKRLGKKPTRLCLEASSFQNLCSVPARSRVVQTDTTHL